MMVLKFMRMNEITKGYLTQRKTKESEPEGIPTIKDQGEKAVCFFFLCKGEMSSRHWQPPSTPLGSYSKGHETEWLTNHIKIVKALLYSIN